MPPVLDLFKPIVDGSVIEGWVKDTLTDWFQVYMEELEVQRAGLGLDTRDSHPMPRSIIVVEDLDREAADQLPAIVIVSPGLNGQLPKKDGDGTYRATWIVGIGIFASANTREATKDLVRFYAAVIRAIMIQKGSLGGNASGTIWTDESYDDDFHFTDTQTISAGQVIFDVEVYSVVTHGAGPVSLPDPDTQPGSQNHHANEVIITLEKEAL